MLGAVLAVGYYFPALGKDPVILNAEEAKGLGVELNAWISIDASGTVTIINHRAEMGQGSFQSVPQIIAEELEVDLDKVKIQFAQGNKKKYGDQVTGGSSTIRNSYKMLLTISATAREMLKEAASKKWGVSIADCYAENGLILNRSNGKSFHYGELVEEASKLNPPKEVVLKNIKDYKLIRKPLPRQDIPSKTNGQTIFGLDKKIPGMLYAVIERNPRFLGKVKSFDDTATKAIPGVKHVFKMEVDVFSSKREGVAVVADSIWSAMQGKKALKVEWDDTGFKHYSTEELFSKMKEASKGESLVCKTNGDLKVAFKTASKKIELVYETPYEAHSCLEPLNCIAHVHDGKCEVWGPIQGPDMVQKDLSEKLGIPMENVIVQMTFLGGGFGRKAFTDYPYEAAFISKEVNAPVQIVWSREDDTTIGPFRPGMVYNFKGGIADDGSLLAFEAKVIGQNMWHQNPKSDKLKCNNSTEGLPEVYLESIPNYTFGDIPMEFPIPVMWWRSVYSSTNCFAFESFIDELAQLAKKDPLDFRRPLLNNNRYKALIAKLEEVSGWNTRKKNEGYGLAITECFKSIVGQVVKISKNAEGKIKIDQVWAVMDCGWFVNPDIIRAQVEGSIVMALGASIKHAILFEDGKTVQKNFDTYKMPRMADIPEIEVHIMENLEDAGGVGEPALPAFAPALTNAIFDLTGKRIRKLPFALEEI